MLNKLFPHLSAVELFILREYSKMSVPNLWGEHHGYFKQHNYTFSKITRFITDIKKLCDQEELEAQLAGDAERVADIRVFRQAFLYDKRVHVVHDLDEAGISRLSRILFGLLFPKT